MILLLLISSLVFTSSLSLSQNQFKIQNSLSRIVYTSILISLFQIFITVSILGFIPGGLESQWIAILNSLFSISVLLINTKAKNKTFDLIKTRYKELNRSKYRYIYYIIASIFLCENIFILLKIYFFPNYVWDEMVYHLHPVVVWFQNHQYLMNIESPSPWVSKEILGSKRLVYWLFVFVGDDSFVNLTQWIGSIFLFLASYRMIYLISGTKYYSILGAFLVFHQPLVLIQTQTNQEHLNLAAFTLGSILVVIENWSDFFRGFIVFLIAVTLMLSTKTSSVIHLVALIPFFFIRYFSELKNLYKNNRLISFLIFIFSIGSFFFIFIKFSLFNFIIPYIGIDFSKEDLFTEIALTLDRYGKTFTLNLSEFPARILDHGYDHYIADSDFISSYGASFLSFGTLGVIFGSYLFIKNVKEEWKTNFLFSYGVLIQFIYFSFYNSPWNYRLFIFFAITSVLSGMSLVARLNLNKVVVGGLVTFLSIFHFISTSISDYATPQRMKEFVFRLKQGERSTLRYYQNLEQTSWRFIRNYLDINEPLAYIAKQDAWIFPYFNSKWERKIHLLPFEIDEKTSNHRIKNDKLEWLKSNNIKYLHIRNENFEDGRYHYSHPKVIHITAGIYYLDQ